MSTRDTCARCGAFVCEKCSFIIQAKRYCEDCAARDDVNWLERYRQSVQGKREGMGWTALSAAAILLLVGLGVMLSSTEWRQSVIAALLIVQGVCSGLFFLRFRAMRWSPLALAVLWLIGGLIISNFAVAAVCIFNLTLLAAIFTDTGNKLFFRLPVQDAELIKYWKRFGDNPMAVTASQLTVLGIFIPIVAPVAMVMGCVALSRVNLDATPPVGKRWSAVGSIVVSGLISLGWAALFLGDRLN